MTQQSCFTEFLLCMK